MVVVCVTSIRYKLGSMSKLRHWIVHFVKSWCGDLKSSPLVFFHENLQSQVSHIPGTDPTTTRLPDKSNTCLSSTFLTSSGTVMFLVVFLTFLFFFCVHKKIMSCKKKIKLRGKVKLVLNVTKKEHFRQKVFLVIARAQSDGKKKQPINKPLT